MKKTIAVLLAAWMLLLPLSSCTEKNDKGAETTDAAYEQKTLPPTVETGVVQHGWVSEGELPQNAALRDWYDEARGRENLSNSLLYAQEDDGTWHCWLYIGTWRDGDLLRIGCETADPNRVILRYIPQYADAALGSTGAHYFTLTGVESPDFSFYLNSDTEGFLSVHSDTSVKR